MLRNRPKSLSWEPANLYNCFNAFQPLQVKDAFCTTPTLAYPNPDLPFVAEVDTSTTGVGAVLTQQQGKPPILHPCVFYSKKLSLAERNYNFGNHELLAIKLYLEE